MDNPLVSIVLTTFGRKKEVKRALTSLLNQTYKNIEVLVVDDNIDQEYSDYVKTLVSNQKDKRIKYIKNKHNLGGALSRNEGIKVAKGYYIAFLDDDDEYMPQKIEKQLQIFKNSNKKLLALVYCYCVEKKDGKPIREVRHNYRGNCLYEGMKTCIATTTQWLCRKDILEKVGSFSNVPCKQDSNVLLKLLIAGYELDLVPEILSIYNDDDVPRISKRKASVRIDGETKLLDLCRKNYDKISNKEIREVEYEFARRLAPYYSKINNRSEFRHNLKIMIKTHPFSSKTIITLLRIYKKKLTKTEK